MSLNAADGGTFEADLIGIIVASKIKTQPPIIMDTIEDQGNVKSAP